MYRYVAILLLGGLLGGFVTHLLSSPAQDARFSQPAPRDLNPQAIDEVSVSEADIQRANHYESVKTIADTLALPTDFAETEALYVVAGRASSEELQDLIYQASRISDKSDSNAALAILFLRLVEVDPLSAVAIARSPAFRDDRIQERNVWEAWGRLDLDAALLAAKQGTATERNVAAQGLYTSLRGAIDDRAELIEAELGIAPSLNTEGQRLYRLASESPAGAIKYIESLDSPAEQQERLRWLAYYLHRTSRALGEDYSYLITSTQNRRIFEQAMTQHRMQTDPEVVLQEALADTADTATRQLASQALYQLAQLDPDKAVAYLEQMPSAAVQRAARVNIAASLARSDPQAGLTWARSNDTPDQQLLTAAITQIAEDDFELALSETQGIDSRQARSNTYFSILTKVADIDPQQGVRVLALMDQGQQRQQGVRQLASAWAQSNPEDAIEWAGTLPRSEQQPAMQSIGQTLPYTDVDVAIRLAQQIPDAQSEQLQQRIVDVLMQRSPEEAHAYVEQFRGTQHYGRLQTEVLSRLAQTNPGLAMQRAGALANTAARDRLYNTIVTYQANQDPRTALSWVDAIEDPDQRSVAKSQIAMVWHQNDPQAADAWTRSPPAGAQKDQAILATISQRSGSVNQVLGVIDAIQNNSSRVQAIQSYALELAQNDREGARQFVRQANLDTVERQRIESYLDQIRQYHH